MKQTADGIDFGSKFTGCLCAYRERFEASLARPLLPQQRVRMLWRDATDPAKGDWYAGMVVQEAEEWAPPAGAIWEGVSVMWDTDSSEQLASNLSHACHALVSALLLLSLC